MIIKKIFNYCIKFNFKNDVRNVKKKNKVLFYFDIKLNGFEK